MNKLLTLTLIAALTACGAGDNSVVLSDSATQVPDSSLPVPTPVPACDNTTYIPCDNSPAPALPTPIVACNPTQVGCIIPDSMEYCDVHSYNPCAVPTWIPRQVGENKGV
jgi:hypothetical protein